MRTAIIRYGLPVGLLVLALLTLQAIRAAAQTQPTFASPGDAVTALVSAARSGNTNQIESLLGPGSEAIVHSGDDADDQRAREQFVARYDARHALVDQSPDQVSLEVGEDAWPLPVPLVRNNGRWHWDGAAGRDEIVYRRIGENELAIITRCRQGATAGSIADTRVPWEGYRYRALDGRMVVAWPADYRSSGVMTFVCDGAGKVWQRDLGQDSEAAASQFTAFKADPSWRPVY